MNHVRLVGASMRRDRYTVDVLGLAVPALGYFLAGKLGLMLAFVNPSASPVWAPTGIAIGSFLLLGNRVWPAIMLAAFLVNVTTTGSALSSVGIAAGNTLEGLLAAILVRRFAHGRNAFDRAQDVFKFTLLAGLVAPTVSATCGVTSISLDGLAEWRDYGAVWFTWWLGDVVGALIVTPVVVLWGLDRRLRWTRGQTLEAAALALYLAFIGVSVFGGLSPEKLRNYPLGFICLPVLLWPAYRFQQREAATASLVLSAIAIWGTLHGMGPFVMPSQNESLLLQAFMAMSTVIALALAAAVAERKRVELQLVHLVDHDPLTGLASRPRFLGELVQQLAQARRYGGGALLFVDLDGFKQVNDTFGHRVGDQLLAGIARVLRARLRDSDVLGRIGGDEFAILLPFCDAQRARAVAGQLAQAVARHAIGAGDRSAAVTASIGIALFPDHGATADVLLRHADAAMYDAKRAGGRSVRLFQIDGGLEDRLGAAFDDEQSLVAAFEQGRFVLHAQPILDLARNRLYAHELLLRMLDETGKPILPGTFLGIAERRGMLAAIDRWVVGEAIRRIGRAGVAEQRSFFVNLSQRDLPDGELLPTIERELGRARVEPARLTLELGEPATLGGIDETRAFARAVKRLGCGLAFTPASGGPASLQQIEHLPVDCLKIDAGFVREPARSAVDQAVLTAMVDATRALRKQTVVENVDSEDMLQLARRCRVDYAQGYYVGPPAALSEA
jgi:diguanylate cyclase (GGDEF)-like protein